MEYSKLTSLVYLCYCLFKELYDSMVNCVARMAVFMEVKLNGNKIFQMLRKRKAGSVTVKLSLLFRVVSAT